MSTGFLFIVFVIFQVTKLLIVIFLWGMNPPIRSLDHCGKVWNLGEETMEQLNAHLKVS